MHDELERLLEEAGGEIIQIHPAETNVWNVLAVPAAEEPKARALHEVVFQWAEAGLSVYDMLLSYVEPDAVVSITNAITKAIQLEMDRPTEVMKIDAMREHYAARILTHTSTLDDRYILAILEILLQDYLA